MWFDVPRQMVLTEMRKRASMLEKVFITYYAVDDKTANIVWGVSQHDEAVFDENLQAVVRAMMRTAFSQCTLQLDEIRFHLDTSAH